jgi:hypothetical protein
MSLLVPSVPYYRNPQLRSGLAALVAFLMEHNYSSHAIGRVFDFVACNGTLEGSLVEEDDMSEAEAAFVDNLPPIDFSHPVWGDTGPEDDDDDEEPLDGPGDEDGTADVPHPILEPDEDGPTEPKDEPRAPDEDYYHPYSPNNPRRQPGGLPPLSGGSPDDTGEFPAIVIDPMAAASLIDTPPYEPTPQDLAELAAWSEHLQRLRDIQDQRDWYDRHGGTAAFNDHVRNGD